MDFSRLHMYTPPQCVPENTGYTYALSSSYSSDALDFETQHKLGPVFDSPRMSRRGVHRLSTATGGGQAGDAQFCTSSTTTLKERVTRIAKQHSSAGRPALRKGAASLRPPVLDESLIREQTRVDHFWGLDDDGDLKGGSRAVIQGNGDMAAEAAKSNGYTCSSCSLLSERKDALTAVPASRGTVSRIYSRDRNQKRKAASGTFWRLGKGWYQFVTLISWLNVFLLTRCLRNICKFFILLIPLLLLLGAGLSLGGWSDLLSFLPVVNWTRVDTAQRVDDPPDTLTSGPLQDGDEALHWRGMSEVQRQVASLSGQCRSHDEKLRELAALLQKLQARVDQMDSDGVSSWAADMAGLHLKDRNANGLLGSQQHELRISNLEDALGQLTEKYEAVQRELQQTTLRTASGAEEGQHLLSVVKQLELELGHLRLQLSRHLEGGCDKMDAVMRDRVDAQVRETVQLLLSDDPQAGSFERLLEKFSSRFVGKDDLQVLLRDLELQILKNISHHVSVTKQMPACEAVVSAVSEAGVSGITEAQAHVIINNALKLYSQDKTGMVDFALESGGGSVLSTRCSETYETKTALVSLFGIPLWYHSQSPRVVIQPDIYPGNCWAFRGSQGYLVVRLSMKIHPTSFTLEHIPKSLSPTGNITSAPKDFSVYGLESEYEEEGQLLGQFTYDQEGESLQMFHMLKRPERAFQIVELRIFSNWGHPEYTCLYRFRVHGEPIK
ncbi:SUN domain-containing protein 1 isoform X9 [Rhinolophus ferrumequinum]|uniref:SUN domain-containing protein 1 isoform X9 n=1 Tax=Rhinolophus ferrumequinum TaxID=59479 RepID=UPI00140FA6C9|nr:SUN domain-containing protein 1 isoform X9 [Rhinolophus ferrumequinum]